MYHSHEKLFKHSLRILINMYSTSSITIKNKKEVTLQINLLTKTQTIKKRFKNICDILLLKEALNANKNRV